MGAADTRRPLPCCWFGHLAPARPHSTHGETRLSLTLPWGSLSHSLPVRWVLPTMTTTLITTLTTTRLDQDDNHKRRQLRRRQPQDSPFLVAGEKQVSDCSFSFRFPTRAWQPSPLRTTALGCSSFFSWLLPSFVFLRRVPPSVGDLPAWRG